MFMSRYLNEGSSFAVLVNNSHWTIIAMIFKGIILIQMHDITNTFKMICSRELKLSVELKYRNADELFI